MSSELERLCQIAINNGLSTGHADDLAQFCEEQLTNAIEANLLLRGAKKRIEELEARVAQYEAAIAETREDGGCGCFDDIEIEKLELIIERLEPLISGEVTDEQ